jgi:predicted nuclease of restriction endonuclease-like (RecB) superfamily
MTNNNIDNTSETYPELLLRAVAVINKARATVARQVNTGASAMHWDIGKLLHDRKIESGHGDGVVKRLSIDLKERYPSMGISPRQLWNMKKFYDRYESCETKLLQSVAVLPWSHNLLMMNKHLDDQQTLFYAQEDVTKGWGREILLNAIKMNTFAKRSSAPINHNFVSTLPAGQAEYANEVFRDSINLGFLGVTEPIHELELERRLVNKVKQFLLELGKGFTYIGNQYELDYNGKQRKVDLLLFHRGLRCLVAIDLKIGEFQPEYVGKMNFYLSLLDRLERGKGENRSIGIILCAEKDRVDVQLALEDISKPIGVADYQLIVPKEELQKLITDEINEYEKNGKE